MIIYANMVFKYVIWLIYIICNLLQYNYSLIYYLGNAAFFPQHNSQFETHFCPPFFVEHPRLFNEKAILLSQELP